MEYDEVDIIMSDTDTKTKEDVQASISVSSQSRHRTDDVDAKSMGIIR